MSEPIMVPLADIILDSRLQMRATMDMNAIDEYAEITLDLAPGKIVQSGKQMWLTDGWHTYHAHKKAGLSEMKCHVREGNFFAALIEAARANSTHGMKRSDADKRRAVATILAQMPSKSDREVAVICQVSPTLVGKVKNTPNPQVPDPPTTSGAVHVDAQKIMCPACTRRSRVGQEVPKKCKDCADLRKANKKPKAPPAPPPSLEDTDSPPPPADDGIVRDDDGNVVPQRLVGVFNLRGLIKEAALALSKSVTPLAEVENSPSWQRCKPPGEVWAKYHKAIKSAAKALRDNRPSMICDVCGGDGGSECHDKGFLTVAEAKNLEGSK